MLVEKEQLRSLGYSLTKKRRAVLLLSVLILCAVIVPNKLGSYNASFTSTKHTSSTGSTLLNVLQNASFLAEGRPTVLVAAATRHYVDFLENLRCFSSSRAGLPRIVFFALDEEAAAYGRASGFSTISLEGPKIRGDDIQDFFSDEFKPIAMKKLHAVRQVLSAGYDVLFSDVDIVLCADIAKDLARIAKERRNEGVEILLMQSDAVRDSQQIVRFNSGLFFASAGQSTIDFLDRAIQYGDIEQKGRVDDQVAMNRIACKPVGGGRELSRKHNKRAPPVCSWKGRLLVEALPLQRYPNGNSFIGKQRIFEMKPGAIRELCSRQQVRIVHNNWIPGAKKKERLWTNGLWSWDENKRTCKEVFHNRSMTNWKK